MARNKEALVLLLDVGPSMHRILADVEKICSIVVQKKLVYSKYDEVGVILFGTEETENELTSEVGGYEHVTVLQNIKVVDGDAVEILKQLPRGTAPGDFLDAIVVGMDMLIKKYGMTSKGKKRLCLITNGLSPIKDPSTGTKEDQVTTIADLMTSQGMTLECVVVRGNPNNDFDERIIMENEDIFKLFPKKASGKTIYVDGPTSLLGAIKTRNINPVTVFRGDLEINSNLKFRVWVYKKTAEEKFPTLKKFSDKAPAADKFATHEVKLDYEYKSIEDEDKVVPPDQRIKGYSYGPQVIPISNDEWEAVKFKPEKSVKILGFTDASCVRRHQYMKDVNIFIAEPGDSDATIAVSAFARAMKDMEKVAIARCVWRQGQGSVVIGVLTPNISNNDTVPDSFYFNVLPFAEDVREFEFFFSKLPASVKPDDEQQKAMDDFVMMMDLAPPDQQEKLLPEFTPNPVLERFYHFLDLKAKNPDAAVPPVDDTLKKVIEPDRELLARNKSIIDTLGRRFEVKEKLKLKKSSRRAIREKPSGSDDEKDYGGVDSTDKSEAVKAETMTIGDLTPIQDFENMMSRRDNPDWVIKAVKEMEDKILSLIEDSQFGDSYDRAVELVAALRKGCIVEQEPKQFNDFMRRLEDFCKKIDVRNFLSMLASKELTLISKTDAEDSDVTDEEARQFLIKKEIV